MNINWLSFSLIPRRHKNRAEGLFCFVFICCFAIKQEMGAIVTPPFKELQN